MFASGTLWFPRTVHLFMVRYYSKHQIRYSEFLSSPLVASSRETLDAGDVGRGGLEAGDHVRESIGRDRLHCSERPPKLTVSPPRLRWRPSSGVTFTQIRF